MNKSFEVEKFVYNGFCVDAPKGGWGQKANYTAIPNKWTNDPGIIECICSDGKTRLIPTCCLMEFKNEDFIKQPDDDKVYFGHPSEG